MCAQRGKYTMNIYENLNHFRGMSVSAAMRLALAHSGRPDAETAALMGWSPSVASRILSNGDYWPSLPSLPRFCEVVGNDIIPRWIVANADFTAEQRPPMDAANLLSSMGHLFKEMGDVAAEGQAALEDGIVTAEEARRILRQLRDVFFVGGSMLARLQANIDAGSRA